MNNFFKPYKPILQIFFLYYFIFTTSGLGLEKDYTGKSLSNYFSGIVALDLNQYDEAYNFLRKNQKLENIHSKYSKVYIESLINSSKINEAFKHGRILNKNKLNFYQSDIVVISKLIKNENFDEAYNYSVSIKKLGYNPLQNLVDQIILSWIKIKKFELDYEEAKTVFETLDSKYTNINQINNIFLSCYYDDKNAQNKFEKLINNKKTNFSRYTFFYVNYLFKKNLTNKANFVLEKTLKANPRNLLLSQLKSDINSKNRNPLQNNFDCKNISNVVAELFYISANALSSQSIYPASNFYINLAKYLNQNFYSYNSLLAENFMMLKDYKKAKKIYFLLRKSGEIYNWYSSKQIAIINIEEDNVSEAIKIMERSYSKLKKPDLYQIYDFAYFLKNNEKFKESIKYYSIILNEISQSHDLYAKATDGRGIAYERMGDWTKAEKDFLNSLKVKPNQAYVINYLAYSWIEKGINIERSLQMLEKANQIKANDGYITDSLGWALYKLKKYNEAMKYLQLAVILMPSDPIVNDHYADVLWMNGKKIQARYYWKYVLKLEKANKELKEEVSKKIINGPSQLF